MSEEHARTALLLIVTGSSLRAEEADRPLAYFLKHNVEERLSARSGDNLNWLVSVVADIRWLHEEGLQRCPTISLGGPGVNMVAQKWLEDVPISMAVEQQFFIQMDPELEEPRVSIWGMNNAETQIAVSSFIQRFLPRFLDHCVEHALEMPAYEPENEDGEDDEDDD